MLDNPYTPGSTNPAFLTGRGHELAVIDDVAARVRSMGRPGGPLLAFYGPRGTGKTSLLRHAQAQAHKAGMLTAWITGRSDTSMVEELARSLNRSVREMSTGEKAKALLHRIDQVQVEFGLPGARVGAQIHRADAAPVVHHLVEDAAHFARNHEHHGLLLFVDEFQEATVTDRKSLLVALQEFDGDAIRPTPVGIVAAGLPSIHAAVTQAATFGERTRFVEVKGLTPAAAAEALRLPAEHKSVHWDDQAITVAVNLAGNYPYKVQVVGDSVWNYARPREGDTITVGAVRGASEAIEDRMDDLYRTRWAAARPEHRQFLEAMALTMTLRGTDRASREEIAGKLNKTSAALSRPRAQLIDRGLIAPSGRGELSFTIPGFADYVHRQADDGQSPTSNPGTDGPTR